MSGCKYIFIRGDRKGETCDKAVVNGTSYCKACSKKTSVVEQEVVVNTKTDVKAQDTKASVKTDKVQDTIKWACGHDNAVDTKFCCQCGVPAQKVTFDQKTVDKLLTEIEEITGLSNKQVIDHITLRLDGDTSVMKYLNLATKKHVLKTTADKKTCVDATQKICADGDSKEQKSVIRLFDTLVGHFTVISQYLQSTAKPDSRTSLQKLIDKIFNNQMEINDAKRKTVPNAVKAQLFELSGGKCYCCGTMIKETIFEAGHIVPHKHGGDIDINNLRAVCNKCNDDMGTMHMHEFMIDNKYVVDDEDTSYIEMSHNMEHVLHDKLTVNPLKDGYQDKVLVILSNHKKYYLTHRVLLMNALYKEL